MMSFKRMRLATVVALLCCFIGPSILSAQAPPKMKKAPSAIMKMSKEAPKKTPKKTKEQKRRESEEKAKLRAERLRAVAKSLGIGAGSTIADIGAGKGRDSWVFADIVGTGGIVYSEEITEEMVGTLKKSAQDKNLDQVRPVLGKGDSSCLPDSSVDMAFMHYVYHHMSQPREMLSGLWKCLKPGGYLVIVDRHRGTLQDWVPREKRTDKHYWIAETTVVREARESGFRFDRCAEDCWPMDDQFVAVFQRPKDGGKVGVDPDAMLPLSVEFMRDRLQSAQLSFERPAFVALGQARKLIEPVMEYSSGPGVDIVLEEWATRKDERPAQPAGVSLSSVLTDKGHVELGSEPIDIVFFFDTYHLLFHHKTLLADLHESLAPGSLVCIMDRKTETELSRREASHRRKISVDVVKQEMAAAGFDFELEEPGPAADRFLLVFLRY